MGMAAPSPKKLAKDRALVSVTPHSRAINDEDFWLTHMSD